MQKELEDADDHRQELENLSILNHLAHPNIVELLASYTYQNKYNLLFPRAEHGTLATLLKTQREDTPFQSDSSFLVALAGLSSAIAHVHAFFERRIDLKLIGCHHDLRPDNILVSDTTFILADFGLSRFKEWSRDSDTPFRRGMGDYLAPECEDLDTFERHRISRSSDIWSFGCILVEAAIYMAYGTTALKDFRDQRRSQVRAFIFYLFHNGPNTPSIVVADWLRRLEHSTHKSATMLVVLAHRMLCMDQAERPKAEHITCRMSFIALTEVAAMVDDLFLHLEAQNDSIDFVIEQLRFKAWKYAIGIMGLDNGTNSLWASDYSEIIQYDALLECLIQIRKHLEWRLLQENDALLDHTQLCTLNDRLSQLLGAPQQERHRNYFKISMIDSDDQRITKQIGCNNQDLFLEKDIRLSVGLRHVTQLMMNNQDTDTTPRQMDSSTIQITDNFGDHSIGRVMTEEQTHAVLVEWRKYGAYSANEVISQKLFERFNAIVKRLSSEKPTSMRALECKGYFHDTSQHAFGILYEIPHPNDLASGSIQHSTLQGVIAETTSKAKLWPVLDDRFRLAHTLAKSILDFHLLGWLHKDLTSSNVAFFFTHRRSYHEAINNPYIIGFNHSRDDDPSAFTEGIVRSGVPGYKHPKYRRDTQGYRPEYDYYSLGIVLMEIGFWRPLNEIVGIKDTYCDEHDRKLRNRIPQLRQYMGRDYCEAVMACISGDFASAKVEVDKASDKGVLMDFESKVLSRLNRRLI